VKAAGRGKLLTGKKNKASGNIIKKKKKMGLSLRWGVKDIGREQVSRIIQQWGPKVSRKEAPGGKGD